MGSPAGESIDSGAHVGGGPFSSAPLPSLFVSYQKSARRDVCFQDCAIACDFAHEEGRCSDLGCDWNQVNELRKAKFNGDMSCKTHYLVRWYVYVHLAPPPVGGAHGSSLALRATKARY